MRLTTEQYRELQQKFDQDGFVHIPAFMDSREMDEIEGHMVQFIRDVVPTLSKQEAMYEDYDRPETLKQIGVGLNVHDPFFARLLTNPRIVEVAEALLGDAVLPQHAQYFSKPPRLGKPTPPHQDGYYFCLVPNEAVSMWIPFDAMDEENGALQYVKGSHKFGVLPHGESQVLGFSQGLQGEGMETVARGEEITCCVQRGDCLIHHALTIHSAGGNSSHRYRRALGLVYYAKRAKVDAAAMRRYLESAQRQRGEMGVA